MKKIIYDINDTEIAKYSAIREKNDILLYYVNIARLILTANESQSREHSKYVKIIVDDFSRVFMRLGKDKIISFTFPFNLINGELYINDISIDNYVLAVFESILRKSINEKVSFYDALCEKNYDNEFHEYDDEFFLKLYFYLISYDSGYFRVDHDKENAKYNHPIDHVDLFYSQKCTCKLGFNNRPEDSFIVEMVNNRLPRKKII